MTVPATVKYPNLRRSLQVAASCLSDEEFQYRVWANSNTPTPEGRFPFSEAIAFVIDDMSPDDRSALVGNVLANKNELAKFRELAARLEALMERIGSRGTFADAAALPEWDGVRSAARELDAALSNT